jgi:hypothetical protein
MGESAASMARIDRTLLEIDEALRSAPPGPAARELRVRLGGLSRVVRGWVHVPPHDTQVSAMLECVLELRGQVARACGAVSPVVSRRSSRPPKALVPAVRTTRPPPRRDTSTRTTRPPPTKGGSQGPPSSRG